LGTSSSGTCHCGRKLRCKEIWVAGADRARNPDEGVPADFSEKRDEYYESLTLPLKAEIFVDDIKRRLKEALADKEDIDAYPHLFPILRRAINWDLIAKQYGEMVKYAKALRLGTADHR
jgi:hypothetical protein